MGVVHTLIDLFAKSMNIYAKCCFTCYSSHSIRIVVQVLTCLELRHEVLGPLRVLLNKAIAVERSCIEKSKKTLRFDFAIVTIKSISGLRKSSVSMFTSLL